MHVFMHVLAGVSLQNSQKPDTSLDPRKKCEQVALRKTNRTLNPKPTGSYPRTVWFASQSRLQIEVIERGINEDPAEGRPSPDRKPHNRKKKVVNYHLLTDEDEASVDILHDSWLSCKHKER